MRAMIFVGIMSCLVVASISATYDMANESWMNTDDVGQMNSDRGVPESYWSRAVQMVNGGLGINRPKRRGILGCAKRYETCNFLKHCCGYMKCARRSRFAGRCR